MRNARDMTADELRDAVLRALTDMTDTTLTNAARGRHYRRWLLLSAEAVERERSTGDRRRARMLRGW